MGIKKFASNLLTTTYKFSHVNPWLLGIPFLFFYGCFIFLRSPSEFYFDEMRYWGYALFLLEGQYAMPSDTFLWNGPGMPFILVPFAKFNCPLLLPRLLNAVWMYLGLVYFYKSATYFIRPNFSMLLTVLLGLYLPFIYVSLPIFYTEVLCFFLISFSIFHFITYLKDQKTKSIFLSGVGLAYLCLTKVIFGYVILMVALISWLYYILRQKTIAIKTVKLSALTLLFCLPYLIYTYSLTNKVFYWSNAGGMQLYWMTTSFDGEYGEWHPFPGDYNPFPSSSDLVFPKEVSPYYKNNHEVIATQMEVMSPLERDQFLKAKSIENIIQHPFNFTKNWVYNCSRLFFGFPFSNKTISIKLLFINGLNLFLLFFILFGIYRSIKFPQMISKELWPILLLAVTYLLATTLVSAYPRFLFVILSILFLWIGELVQNYIFDK